MELYMNGRPRAAVAFEVLAKARALERRGRTSFTCRSASRISDAEAYVAAGQKGAGGRIHEVCPTQGMPETGGDSALCVAYARDPGGPGARLRSAARSRSCTSR